MVYSVNNSLHTYIYHAATTQKRAACLKTQTETVPGKTALQHLQKETAVCRCIRAPNLTYLPFKCIGTMLSSDSVLSIKPTDLLTFLVCPGTSLVLLIFYIAAAPAQHL